MSCVKSFIDEKVIAKITEEVLRDQKFNQTLIPDRLESVAYQKIVSSSLNATVKALEQLKVEFMGHELCMYIQPKNFE